MQRVPADAAALVGAGSGSLMSQTDLEEAFTVLLDRQAATMTVSEIFRGGPQELDPAHCY